MLPPRFDDLPTAIRLTLQTLWMAIVGTAIGAGPLGPAGIRSRPQHDTERGGDGALLRGVIALARAIPDVVFTLVLVRSLGIGVLPGVLALGLHSIGMIGKLFADAIEQIDEQPREAALSTGATKWQAITTAVVPQVMPSFIAVVLYRLDINLRSSTVLGFVGAGGVGFLLQAELRGLDYAGALGVVIVVFVCITLVELLSALVRASLIGGERTIGGRADPRFSLGAMIGQRWTRRVTDDPPVRRPLRRCGRRSPAPVDATPGSPCSSAGSWSSPSRRSTSTHWSCCSRSRTSGTPSAGCPAGLHDRTDGHRRRHGRVDRHRHRGHVPRRPPGLPDGAVGGPQRRRQSRRVRRRPAVARGAPRHPRAHRRRDLRGRHGHSARSPAPWRSSSAPAASSPN